MNKSNYRKKGFGILEVLLASMVIIIVMGGLVYLARNSIISMSYGAQHSQATFLAQEGIELVRQIRDTNYIDGDSNTKWDTLAFDSQDNSIPLDRINNYAIRYKSTSNKYELKNIDLNTDNILIEGTDFKRVINVRLLERDANKIFEGNEDLSDNAYVVDCIVTWTSTRGGMAEVKITEMMTNSRQGL